MPVTRISSKGQVVLPQPIRKRRKWRAGTELIVEETKDGVLLRAARPFPPTTYEEVEGLLQYKGKPKTIEEMDAAIAKGIKERHARGR
ncbi:MAG TPA: AbrB/MazE/SpoVT family DNA-binding domain-containing protein [Acidobacteriaceae bacterium]|nr:AbrB/MazE/SpoVT family DNA-binding domain-containing protein [Acidobacteriaceae bacterium]